MCCCRQQSWKTVIRGERVDGSFVVLSSWYILTVKYSLQQTGCHNITAYIHRVKELLHVLLIMPSTVNIYLGH